MSTRPPTGNEINQLKQALTPDGDAISTAIGDNVRNVAAGKDINQTIVEGDVNTGGGDFVGRDQIINYVKNHFGSGSDPLPLYINVPALPPHFMGRDQLINQLTDRLCAGQTTALSADGLPGVGKTTLAVALARLPRVLDHFSDGVLWAGLGRTPDVASIQATWAEHLGARITDVIDPLERMKRINDAIGQRRLLMVLDDAWQAEPLEHLRATGPNVVQVLTTRDRAIARNFAGARQEVTVGVLAEAPSHALLRTLAPEAWNADPAAAAGLADHVGGLPLALELLGGYLAAPERSLFPELSAAAFAELADPQTRLQLAQVRLGSLTGKEETLAGTIALSLDELAKVKPAAVDAFYRLGAFAPKPARFDLEAAKAVTQAGAATLALLVARSLLEQEDSGLVLHQTLSDVARAQTDDDAIVRHRGHYLTIVNRNPEDWHGIEAIYPQVSFARLQSTDTITFADDLFAYQRRRGLWKESLSWLTDALTLARDTNDQQAEARLLNNMGLLHDALGDKAQALNFYNQALPIDRQMGNSSGEAITLNNIGGVHYALGDRRQALIFYNQVLPLLRQVGDIFSQGATLNNIGLVYDALDDKQKALELYNQALPLRRRVDDISGQATTLNNIGGVYSALGDKQRALDFFNQALPLQRQSGDISGQATTLNNIGGIQYQLGNVDEAIESQLQVIEIYRNIKAVAEEAGALSNLAAAIHFALGETDQAIEMTKASIDLLENRDLPQDAMGQTPDQKRAFLAELTGEAPSPQQDDALTLDQLFDLVAQARQGDRQLGEQLYNSMQDLAANAGQPAETRALARVLVRILTGVNDPDLTGLPAEYQTAVRELLERL